MDRQRGGDFQVGQDARTRDAGPSYSAGAPTNLVAVQNGTTGAVSCVYNVSNDDGAGGLSAGVSVVVSNANATLTTANYIRLTYTPPVNQDPGVIYRNCGAGETFVGVAQPRIVATMTAGSGYTNGMYIWTATGGGCAVEPQGWIAVGGPGEVSGQIATDLGRVDLANPGSGMHKRADRRRPRRGRRRNRRRDHAIFVATFDDTGPACHRDAGVYPAAAHPATTLSDWLVGTIGAINSNVLTLCTTGVNRPAVHRSWPRNAVTVASIRHSWTRQIQNAITRPIPATIKPERLTSICRAEFSRRKRR